MKQFMVAFTDSAVQDLAAIDEWVSSLKGPHSAERLVDALLDRVDAMARLPNRGSALSEFHGLVYPHYRQVVCRGYRIIHRIDRETLYVLAVIHQRRDIASAMLSRLQK